MVRIAPLAVALIVAGLLSGCATLVSPPLPESRSPYAALTATSIRGLSPSEIEALREGQGAGLALPAELNGYPGPKHVLELADELALAPAQSARIEALQSDMKARAIHWGEIYLARFAALEEAFRSGAIENATLDDHVQGLANAQAALRATHLRTHLATKDVLTREQIASYHALRGYGELAPEHKQADPSGHGEHGAHATP